MRNTLSVPHDEPSVRVLGPVQLLGVGRDVIELPSAAQRRLLGVLAIHASTPVRTEWLCGVLDVTSGALRTSVSRLRRLVGEDALQTTVGGYRLDATVDATLACAELQAADGDAVAITRALERWVGNALEEFADEAWAVGEAVRLAAIRAAAVEDLGEALIADRRPDDALAVLEPHIVEHPHRDRPRGLAIRALAASGRQTEALRAFQRYRDELAETAGTEPSAELRAIDQRVATGWDGFDGRGSAGAHRPAEPASPRVTPPLHEVLVAVPTSVGRRRERALLAHAAEQARHVGVRTVLVSGGAGIGKTTLLATFAREASGWDVFYGRCDEHVVVPYHPFQSVVGRVVDTLPSDVLMAHTAAWGGDLLRLLPHVAGRIAFSVPVAGDDGTDRHQMFNAVLDVIERAAAIAPLILVLDDLHWAEPAALQLLRYLVHNLGAAPVLFVLGFRQPAELTAVLADAAPAEAARIELQGLDVDELAALVHERLTDTARRDVGPVAARLHAETAGNPLFAEHLLRHWIEIGHIEVDDDVASLAPVSALELPPALRDLVWHRVAALGPEAQPVLTAAAMFGVQFNQRVLTAMTDLADHKVAALLGRAVAAGILADHPSLSGNVRFTHALVARALEAELGSRAAKTLHAQAFEAMLAAQATPPVELAPQLARHAELGGLLGEAQRWATSAGELALSELAPHEAVRWFGKALDHASTLGGPDAERADLLVRLGEAATRAGHPNALETIRQGAELAEACGADATLIRAALATTRGSLRSLWSGEQLAIVEAAVAQAERADLATRARLTALLAQSLEHTGQTGRRQAAALEALELARSSLDPTLLARVAPDVLYALWTPGAASVRAELAAEATAIANEANDPHLAFVVHHVSYGAAVCVGDASRARRYLGRLHDIADQIGEPLMRWHVGILDTCVATMTARFEDAERIANATLELGMQIGDPDAFGVFAGQFFFLGTFAGRHAELLPIVQKMMDTDPHVEPLFRAGHALVCCEVGRPEVGRAVLRDAMAAGLDVISQDSLGSTTLIAHAVLAIELDDVIAAEWLFPAISPMAGEVSFNGVTSQGPVSAYLGKLASLLGRYDDAERHLLDALATTEAFGWEYHRAITLIALAQNRVRATGTLDAVGEGWLSNAEELCATYGITSWVKRTVKLRELLSMR